VTDVQLGEGGLVAGPRLFQQLGVGEGGDRHGGAEPCRQSGATLQPEPGQIRYSSWHFQVVTTTHRDGKGRPRDAENFHEIFSVTRVMILGAAPL
jgi:hypothetical protein